MVKARKKLSKSAWILLAVIFFGIIAVVVLAAVGYISVAFIGDALIGLALWMSQSPINVALVIGVSFAGGMGVFYWLKAYIIGEEQVLIGAGLGGYNPAPSTPAAQQQSNTEIS